MENTIIFNHIPRTGGTTFRVILNKVYGEKHVFFINSRDIAGSLATFRAMSREERNNYRVISGHGAENFAAFLENPFRITILREPVSLFISQYYYLRKSPNSNFLEDVSSLSSLNEYIDYALQNGQDNMMVRCLDPENKQFSDSDFPVSSMENSGEAMMQLAFTNLQAYDAVLDLSCFDRDLFILSGKLRWNWIPMYRPLNQSIYPKNSSELSTSVKERLKDLLRFDIELYRQYRKKTEQEMKTKKPPGIRYLAFRTRQKALKFVFK